MRLVAKRSLLPLAPLALLMAPLAHADPPVRDVVAQFERIAHHGDPLGWHLDGPFGDTKLRILGSYVQHDESAFSDQDHSDVPIATLEQNEFNREYVAELNWSSDGGHRFGWLLGAFFGGILGLLEWGRRSRAEARRRLSE